MSPTSALKLRHQFAGLAESAHKQIGLRRIREARQFQARDDMQARVRELLADAAYYLRYAIESDRREREAA